MAFAAKTPQIQTPTQNHGRCTQSEQIEIGHLNIVPPIYYIFKYIYICDICVKLLMFVCFVFK